MTKWINIKDSKPEKYIEVYLICEYENGNKFTAVGCLMGDEWEFFYSDEFPEEKNIKYWLEVDWEDFK